ncbi:MBOAT family O-acyltransferase [Clostridium sp. Marseille-P299]|uniref:MBOAT family O-acyltransferase n=1 Tax=Clostridium sp. Marseille-P299 TaxID=1805477 RepID=UPI00083792C2|nr:MBOAT family O-acyltransferase [Clostridium sp. Marseille-P299]
MIFSSSTFLLVFLPCVLLIYYTILRNHRTAQNIFLFLASLVFYAWGEPLFVLILLLSIVMNYIFGLLIDKYRDFKPQARLIITLSLVYNVSLIFLFKYLSFAITNINLLFNKNIGIPQLGIPIGISFFTFQAISYVIDVYHGKGHVQKNPLNVGLYIALFPNLVSGPIVRYETIVDQINDRKESFSLFSEGAIRFIRGFAKKVIIADNLAYVANKAFSLKTDDLSVSFAWLGIIAYAFQILLDFSGYSDMALGLSKMFGFNFLENFNFPYISKSISEFWRRWHISLGTWFRDYVYFPLGGSRVKTKFRLLFNLFVVWSLTGLWHGANWTFICWGLLYFVLLAFEKLTGFDKSKKFPIFHHIYTMFFVLMGWVLFRANDITQAKDYLKVMFFRGGNTVFDNNAYFYLCEYIFFLVVAILCSTPVFGWISKKFKFDDNKFIGAIYPIFYLLLFFIALTYVIKGANNPSIYANF